ncbi:M48 family metalloprotease [Saccharopolyspora sp. HNM0983]|uniref:M48 family metalloprotease n=1 Tax=Saccharopolyspora montiporae TaxID=2781240 RepID=A0A929B9Q8_9PSEU|nr:M48 family metalloprotease [Saccharopolyspora sp. HNM0983]MBE9375899.1 M48 family metalloprotease [Saccharopolyspora sp. HNM0983]
MPTDPAPRRVDERVLGAGTTVRFALLAVLLIVASGAMMQDVLGGVSGSSNVGCALAGGADPDDDVLQTKLALMPQYEAYEECRARFEPPPPWWIILGWPVLVVAGTALLFRAIPVWKVRRHGLVALQQTSALRQVRDAAQTAGLVRMPRIVVDPAAASTDAVVFGSNRRPTVCLHGGLVARAGDDPERFRAVVLHELAHIRHGDVTLTYTTVAMWRVFLGAVLLPYAVWALTALTGGFWASDRPIGARAVLLIGVLVVLVYLARSDVLRSRELYADLAALRWGAHRSTWRSAPAPGRTSFLDVWRVHPRRDLRSDAVQDPAVLFAVRALPMFLTGVAATLISAQLRSHVSYVDPDSPLIGWIHEGLTLVVAGLVMAVAGMTLWRGVVHAVLTTRRVPSGARAGLWLGAGMVVGELMLNRVAVTEWLPPRPEFLLLVVLAGAGIGWWVEQCARLSATTWPSHRVARSAMVAGLAAAGLALSSWFVWWQGTGTGLTSGSPFGTEQIGAVLARGLGGGATEHAGTLHLVAAVLPLLDSVSAPAFVLTAVGALWIVPLLAWAVDDGTPRWLRSPLASTADRPASETALPRLRRVLLPGVLAGVLGWVGVLGVQAYLHTWQPLPQGAGAIYSLGYFAWLLAVLVAATAVAAVAAAVPAGPYRLLSTLIAAETAAVVGFSGMYALTAIDGCIEPLSTLQSSCRWHPIPAGMVFGVMLTPVLVAGAIAAGVAAAAGAVVRPSTGRSPQPYSGSLPARRRVVGLLIIAAVGTAAVGIATRTQNHPDADESSVAQLVAPTEDRPVPVLTRKAQVNAWYEHGGEELALRLHEVESRFSTALSGAAEAPTGRADVSSFLPVCVDFGRIARDAQQYFRIPDPRADAQWVRFSTLAGRGSENCATALDRHQESMDPQTNELFRRSLDELLRAEAAANATLDRLITVLRG